MTANPLMIGAMAVGALLLLNKRRQVSPRQAAIQSGAQTYSTPTSVAAALGAFVSAYTRGATPTVRTDNVTPINWTPIDYGQAMQQAGNDWLSSQSLGIANFSAGAASSDPSRSWSPSLSLTSATSAADTGATDSNPAGAVYDLSKQFQMNPYNFMAGA